MPEPPSPLPDAQSLVAGLTSIFGCGHGGVTLLGREPGIYSSSFPSEIVTCRLLDGSPMRLFCKYDNRWRERERAVHSARGHRGGIAYEAEVYRRVLQSSPVLTAKFHGVCRAATGQTWLVLEDLTGSLRANQGSAALGMREASRWIGRFHAVHEGESRRAALSFVRRYDADYYRGWARRTLRFTRLLDQDPPWLPRLFQCFEDYLTALLHAPPTVIHGEYYPENILCRDGTIYPVDWESAALAPGEIDLAFLTDGWDAAMVRACELEYQQARWPEGPPENFRCTLAAARLYQVFRWLGGRRAWTTAEDRRWCLEQLRAAGGQLGLD